MPNNEIFINSLFSENNISLSKIVEIGVLPKNIREVHLALEKNPDPEMFTQLLTSLFKVEITDQIPVDNSQAEREDLLFARQFGYTPRHIAVGRVTDDGLQAWIGTTLIHKTHPLSDPDKKNSIFVAENASPLPDKTLSLLESSRIVSAHYLRLTVQDEPLVLSKIAQALGEKEINICEVRQPERNLKKADPLTGHVKKFDSLTKEWKELDEEDNPPQIALLLDPSRSSIISEVISSLKNIPEVTTINSLFRVIGHPTRDISNSSIK